MGRTNRRRSRRASAESRGCHQTRDAHAEFMSAAWTLPTRQTALTDAPVASKMTSPPHRTHRNERLRSEGTRHSACGPSTTRSGRGKSVGHSPLGSHGWADDEAPETLLRAGAVVLAEMGRFELPRGFHPNLLSREAH